MLEKSALKLFKVANLLYQLSWENQIFLLNYASDTVLQWYLSRALSEQKATGQKVSFENSLRWQINSVEKTRFSC